MSTADRLRQLYATAPNTFAEAAKAADELDALTAKMAEESAKLTHVLTAVEEGTLPWWQAKHDEMAIRWFNVAAQLDALAGENKRLRELLRQCEWTKRMFDDNGIEFDACRFCLNAVGNGHKPDCALAAALKDGK